MEKIGIIGGSFDPIHYGHLILAEQARDGAGLDRVIFIPANTSPYKMDMKIASGCHRYAMVQLAIAGNDGFTSSEIELKGPEVSYTFNTLSSCKLELGKEVQIHFICGSDAFLHIEGWLDADKLLRNFPLIVGSRPKYKDLEMEIILERLSERYDVCIQKIKMPKIDISSTDIKARIREGRSIKYLVPESVEDYIYKNELYL